MIVFYYESINREEKTRPIYECRYDERLKTLKFVVYFCLFKTNDEESTSLLYTLIGEHNESIKRESWPSRCLLLIDKVRVKDKTYI
jgi:hypothetical protein